MTKRLHVAVLAILVAMTALPAMADGPRKATLQIEGSTTVGPIAVGFVEAFKKDHPEIDITVKQSGSGDGAAALIDSRCQIATMSRFMKPEEWKKASAKGLMPVAQAIAMDGVCIVVHPSNPVKNLTIAQLHDIYTGKITNWKDLGGADKAIVVISRDSSSGTYETFEGFVMKKDKMSDKVEYVSANPQAHDRAAGTEGAIAYVGLGFVDDKVKAVSVESVTPSRKTVTGGTYPLSRPLFMFTNGYPKLGSPEHLFTSFFLTPKGQEIIEAKGFVPVTNY